MTKANHIPEVLVDGEEYHWVSSFEASEGDRTANVMFLRKGKGHVVALVGVGDPISAEKADGLRRQG